MAQTNFRAQDFKRGVVGSTRDRKPAPVRQTAPEPTTKPVVDPANPDAVPTGTAPEILTWVGDDKEKAQKALDVEKADEKPRKGLVSELEKLLAEDDEDSEEAKEDSEEDSEESE